ncbi:hypothetical protein IV53_GL000001 [Ligilactobacillus ceti DSM 22408]|uniref:SpaA-like prealbumin fold domain-containing protein n=1 Tax=Ligilactobacillus ceti DSM 22408 TaxID=1122146 RepID=A0A0R2KP92_9LACO|nr:hypothetical protein IV53_GL000001 [Ligilactobacillus ceti DSM 22408]
MSQKFINKQAIWMLLVLLINFLVSPVTSVMAAHSNNAPETSQSGQARSDEYYNVAGKPDLAQASWNHGMTVFYEGTKTVAEEFSFCMDERTSTPAYNPNSPRPDTARYVRVNPSNPSTFYDQMWKGVTGRPRLGREDAQTLYDFVKRAVYVYAVDPENIQKKYHLTNSQFFNIVQNNIYLWENESSKNTFWKPITDSAVRKMRRDWYTKFFKEKYGYITPKLKNIIEKIAYAQHTNYETQNENDAAGEVETAMYNPTLIPKDVQVETRIYKSLKPRVQSVFTIRLKRKVEFEKQDMKHKVLPGAQLKIVNKDTGKTVDSWTSAYNRQTIYLPEGHYRFEETKAPTGYEKANPIDFTIHADMSVTWNGSGYPIVMQDKRKKIKVKFKKTDIKDVKELLGGQLLSYGTLTKTKLLKSMVTILGQLSKVKLRNSHWNQVIMNSEKYSLQQVMKKHHLLNLLLLMMVRLKLTIKHKLIKQL